MANKSQIRQEIENILGVVFNCCYVDSRKKGVRIKLCTENSEYLTPEKMEKILALSPNIRKVKYRSSQKYYTLTPGICVYLDCSTKNVKFNKTKKLKKLSELKEGDILIASRDSFMDASTARQFLTKNKKYEVKKVDVFQNKIKIFDDESDLHTLSFCYIENQKLFSNIEY